MSQRIFDSGFSNWTADRLPDLTGKRFVITGGNTGLGFEAAKMLAAKNADIVIACRNAVKARMAVSEIARLGKGSAECVHLDLSNMASVHSAAAEIRKRHDGIDAVVNNAGVMQTPHRQTADGFELQLATNHLGHFLLDGLLFDLVEKRAGRIVAVASIAHKRGRIHLDDLMLTGNYSPTRAYCQTKLANLMFALELDRRLKAAGSPVSAIACHPGYTPTNLQIVGPHGAMRAIYRFTNRFFGQSVAQGAVPLVLAAAGTEAKSGGYYGPTGPADAWGPVTDSPVTDAALDAETAKRLWAASEKLVGFKWSEVLQQRKAA
jgi:NAD(P)-dependent dehydrogenase (short-subunit alcohol dehydrogenase family)